MPDLLLHALIALLVLGATLRLTRLVTTDKLGGWLLAEPAERWAFYKEMARRNAMRITLDRVKDEALEEPVHRILDRWENQLSQSEPISWQARLVSGLSCPFCVGFWIALGMTAATWLLAPLPGVGVVWLLFLAALTLNYVAAHVGSRID